MWYFILRLILRVLKRVTTAFYPADRCTIILPTRLSPTTQGRKWEIRKITALLGIEFMRRGEGSMMLRTLI